MQRFMIFDAKIFAIATLAAGGLSLTGCGSVNQLAADAEKAQTSAASSAQLTDSAANSESQAAESQAAEIDATDDGADDQELPSFLAVIQEARDYTRRLLGISDEPLKEFKAAIDAAKALATDFNDFKAKIEPAREALKTALDAQKAAADQARIDHKDELDKIFSATQAVFKACTADIGFAKHVGGPGVGGGKRMFMGSGEFRGNLADLKTAVQDEQQGQAGEHDSPRGGRGPRSMQRGFGGPGEMGFGEGRGPRLDNMLSSSESAECQAAETALKALIPSAS